LVRSFPRERKNAKNANNGAICRLASPPLLTRGVYRYLHATYNKIGALKHNATVAIDDQRPLLSGGGTADAPIPNSVAGLPVTADAEGKLTQLGGVPVTYNTKGMPLTIAGSTAMTYDPYHRIASDTISGLFYTYDGVNRSSTFSNTLPGHVGVYVRKDFWLYDGVDHPLEHDDYLLNRQYYEVDLAGNVRRLVGSGGADLGGYPIAEGQGTDGIHVLRPSPLLPIAQQ
jgi:hypothetical protein